MIRLGTKLTVVHVEKGHEEIHPPHGEHIWFGGDVILKDESGKKYTLTCNDQYDECQIIDDTHSGKTEEEIYLDWINNFITVESFADHYGFSEEYAEQIIERNKKGSEANG